MKPNSSDPADSVKNNHTFTPTKRITPIPKKKPSKAPDFTALGLTVTPADYKVTQPWKAPKHQSLSFFNLAAAINAAARVGRFDIAGQLLADAQRELRAGSFLNFRVDFLNLTADEFDAAAAAYAAAEKTKVTPRELWFGAAKAYAVERNFKNPDGWAANRFREKFGDWPNDAEREAELKETTPDVERHLRLQYLEAQKKKFDI